MAKANEDKTPSGQQRGVVVMFDAERGFGFIRPDGVKEGEEKEKSGQDSEDKEKGKEEENKGGKA